ncbi:hypothetical protein HK405_014543, partial [Cladochytrium tenue]
MPLPPFESHAAQATYTSFARFPSPGIATSDDYALLQDLKMPLDGLNDDNDNSRPLSPPVSDHQGSAAATPALADLLLHDGAPTAADSAMDVCNEFAGIDVKPQLFVPTARLPRSARSKAASPPPTMAAIATAAVAGSRLKRLGGARGVRPLTTTITTTATLVSPVASPTSPMSPLSPTRRSARIEARNRRRSAAAAGATETTAATTASDGDAARIKPEPYDHDDTSAQPARIKLEAAEQPAVLWVADRRLAPSSSTEYEYLVVLAGEDVTAARWHRRGSLRDVALLDAYDARVETEEAERKQQQQQQQQQAGVLGSVWNRVW